MPTTLIESDSYAATLTVPNGGEPAAASTFRSQYLQPVANRLKYLSNRNTEVTASVATNTAAIAANSASLAAQATRLQHVEDQVVGLFSGTEYVIPIPLVDGICTDTGTAIREWYPVFSSYNTRPILARSTNGVAAIIFDITRYLPRSGGALSGADAIIQPMSGHSSLPATMPEVKLFCQGDGFGTSSFAPAITTIATGTDGSASVANYELVHTVSAFPGTPVPIDRTVTSANHTKSYFVQLKSEGGSYSVSGCVLVGIRLFVIGANA